jgi:hypothetical protein
MGLCILAVLAFEGMDGYMRRKARREVEGKKPLRLASRTAAS